MKRLYLIILLIFISTITNAQWQATVGPSSGLVYCLAIKDSIVFAGTPDGIYKSTDDGVTWTIASTGLYYFSGHYDAVHTLAIKGTKIIAGTGLSGVYVSSDSGTSWSAVNNGITDLWITAFAVRDSIIYTGTRNGGGVFRSTDNGANWTTVNNGITNTYIRSLAVSDSNIYAGTTFWDGRAFRSTDNGANWIVINNGLGDTDIVSLAVHGNDIFAGTKGMGIYHSADNGTNWTATNNGLNDFVVTSFAFVGSNIIAGLAPQGSHNYGGIYLSKDNGSSWTLWNEGMIPGYFNIECLATNNDYIFAGTGGSGVWRRKLSDLSGIEEISDNIKILIYPNPTADNLSVETPEKATIEILNIEGQIIQTFNTTEKQTTIDVADLSSGVYIIKAKTERGVAVKKFIKE